MNRHQLANAYIQVNNMKGEHKAQARHTAKFERKLNPK